MRAKQAMTRLEAGGFYSILLRSQVTILHQPRKPLSSLTLHPSSLILHPFFTPSPLASTPVLSLYSTMPTHVHAPTNHASRFTFYASAAHSPHASRSTHHPAAYPFHPLPNPKSKINGSVSFHPSVAPSFWSKCDILMSIETTHTPSLSLHNPK